MGHPAEAVKYQIVPFTRGIGIEVGGGLGNNRLYSHFGIPGDQKPASLDFVFAVGRHPLAELAGLLKPGGYLITYDDGELRVMQQAGAALLEVELPHVGLPKTVCVVRYGGFGDSIQAANILPELKRQGYHITFCTTPRGQHILRHDPHIDAWLIQDDDQVPNQELPYFWQHWAPQFSKFVNLSESVEGTLLAFPGRANHQWPLAVRQVELNKNYLEWTAALAELPYHSEGKFYPDPDEVAQAQAYLNEHRVNIAEARAGQPLRVGMAAPAQFNVMWCLAGSSVHKAYPHQDAVIQRMLDEMPEAFIVLVGDASAAVLEQGWEDHPRVRCECGDMGIRETLALAQLCDLVVGPETGVLNAVAFEDNAKVVMLSHSSKRNLSMHWLNTSSLQPANTSCYPCHQLHFGPEFCRRDPVTHSAACQTDISPGYAFNAIWRAYEGWAAMRDTRKVA